MPCDVPHPLQKDAIFRHHGCTAIVHNRFEGAVELCLVHLLGVLEVGLEGLHGAGGVICPVGNLQAGQQGVRDLLVLGGI